MWSTLSLIAPILAGFFIGHVLQRTGVAKEEDSGFLFKLVFYVGIPALVFNSLATVEINRHLLIYSLLALLLYVVGFVVGRYAMSRSSLHAIQKPVFLIAVMAVNSVFALPYLQSLYGSEGVARFVAYDLVNTILLYSWAYSIAVRANPNHQGKGMLKKRLLQSPPLYAVVAGLIVNVANLDVPDAILNTTKTFSAPTGFLVTIAIGIALHPKRDHVRIALQTIALRTGSALVVGIAIIAAFGLTDADRAAVLIFCVAPVAFSSATFASLENLDVRFAAGTLSISLAVGIVLTTAVALAFA